MKKPLGEVWKTKNLQEALRNIQTPAPDRESLPTTITESKRSDRLLAGLLALLVRPTRLLRSAIALKPAALLGLHKALRKQK